MSSLWEFCQRMHLTPELNPAAVLLLSSGQTAGQYLCGKQQKMGWQENNYPPFPCLLCSSVCFELHVWHHLAHDAQKNQALTSCLWLWEYHHNHGNHIPERGHAATMVVRNTTGKQISVLDAILCACWFIPTGLALYQDVKKSIRNVQIHARKKKKNNCATIFRHKELKRERVPV